MILRITIVITTLLALQATATFLVPILTRPELLRSGVSFLGVAMLVGFVCIPVAAPLLWTGKKAGLWIVAAGAVLVGGAALIQLRPASFGGLVGTLLGWTFVHLVLLAAAATSLRRVPSSGSSPP